MALARKQLDELQRALLERARVLRGEIHDKLGDAASDAGGMNRGGDYGDQAFASGESSLDLAEAGRDIGELRQIEAALVAIDKQEYGQCADCGDDIPAERLLAQPLALRCVPCQQRHERASGERHGSI